MRGENEKTRKVMRLMSCDIAFKVKVKGLEDTYVRVGDSVNVCSVDNGVTTLKK